MSILTSLVIGCILSFVVVMVLGILATYFDEHINKQFEELEKKTKQFNDRYRL